MILILSTDIDSSTYDVMKFISYKGEDVCRINDNDLLRVPLKLYHKGDRVCFQILINERWIHSTDITVVWYRKFGFFINYEGHSQLVKAVGKTVSARVATEYRKILDLFLKSLDHCHWLCHYDGINQNKFDVLAKAKSCGLTIPESIITSTRSFLNEGAFAGKSIITKSVGDILFISPEGEDHEIAVLTTDLTRKRDSLADHFFPSLIQERIDKKFELRIFYLDGHCYTMAIFSQSNAQTRVDFRQYDYQNPNRWVPYELEPEIEAKLRELMHALNLNTGSIDMIYSDRNEYVFLEVNPSGQFGMTSYPCNYNLEEKIADYLINARHTAKKQRGLLQKALAVTAI